MGFNILLAADQEACARIHAATRKLALEVAHLWDAPEVVHEFFRTGNKSLRDDSYKAIMKAYGAVHFAQKRTVKSLAWKAAYEAIHAGSSSTAWDLTEFYASQTLQYVRAAQEKLQRGEPLTQTLKELGTPWVNDIWRLANEPESYGKWRYVGELTPEQLGEESAAHQHRHFHKAEMPNYLCSLCEQEGWLKK